MMKERRRVYSHSVMFYRTGRKGIKRARSSKFTRLVMHRLYCSLVAKIQLPNKQREKKAKI